MPELGHDLELGAAGFREFHAAQVAQPVDCKSVDADTVQVLAHALRERVGIDRDFGPFELELISFWFTDRDDNGEPGTANVALLVLVAELSCHQARRLLPDPRQPSVVEAVGELRVHGGATLDETLADLLDRLNTRR